MSKIIKFPNFGRSLKILLLFVSIMTCGFMCQQNSIQVQKEENYGPKVVTYIRTWPYSTLAGIESQYWDHSMIKGEWLSDLNIAFARLNPDFSITIPGVLPTATDPVPAFSHLFDELYQLRQKYSDLKINLSIGGWGADGFSDMALSSENRAKFIHSVISFLEERKFDGVDIDWEYPVGPDWGLPIKTRPEDAENILLLSAELRAALDSLGMKKNKKYQLSIAVPANPWYIEKIDVDSLATFYDFIKVMTYDFYGGWSQTTGHQANLFQNPQDPQKWSVNQAIQMYLDAGIPSQKILLGIPFYGRAWSGVEKNNNGLFQPFKQALYPDGLLYTDIVYLKSRNENLKYFWDSLAHASFLYDGDMWITYDDEVNINEKTKYVRKNKLGGIMIWEYMGDTTGKLLQVIHDSWDNE